MSENQLLENFNSKKSTEIFKILTALSIIQLSEKSLIPLKKISEVSSTMKNRNRKPKPSVPLRRY